MADDTHRTLGRDYRTPAHPNMLAAMGRALYNFLSLEESVTAVMYDAGAAELSRSRGHSGASNAQHPARTHLPPR